MLFACSVSFHASVSSERVAGRYLAQGRQVPTEGSPGWSRKPNSPVSFIRNQPDILIFRFLHISVGIKLGECNFISWPLQTSEASRIKSVGPIWHNTTYARTIFIKDNMVIAPPPPRGAVTGKIF